ncbi:MAG: hypothetical protein AAF726_21545, partial [Planctomycetota bacterium]
RERVRYRRVDEQRGGVRHRIGGVQHRISLRLLSPDESLPIVVEEIGLDDWGIGGRTVREVRSGGNSMGQ